MRDSGGPGGHRQLHRLIARVAAAGQLRMSVERAVQLVHATAVGVVLSLLATPPAERDLTACQVRYGSPGGTTVIPLLSRSS